MRGEGRSVGGKHPWTFSSKTTTLPYVFQRTFLSSSKFLSVSKPILWRKIILHFHVATADFATKKDFIGPRWYVRNLYFCNSIANASIQNISLGVFWWNAVLKNVRKFTETHL